MLSQAIGDLFLVMAAGQWRKRPKEGEKPKMPTWMATIESVSWTRAVLLDTALAVAVFVAIGASSVVGSVVFYVAAPRRAERPLASIKQFMSSNNATIMLVVLLLLGAKFLGDGLGGLWS